MRRAGVDLPKWFLRETAPMPGALEVLDVRDDGVGLTVKVVRHTTRIGRPGAKKLSTSLT